MVDKADKTGFKPKAIVKKLLSGLPERSRVVIEARFGLGVNPERVTLAKNIIIWATMGVAVMLGSYIIINFLFGQVLQLSV